MFIQGGVAASTPVGLPRWGPRALLCHRAPKSVDQRLSQGEVLVVRQNHRGLRMLDDLGQTFLRVMWIERDIGLSSPERAQHAGNHRRFMLKQQRDAFLA